jgi:hypothetical protein
VHVKLTGAMVLVLALDGAGYFVAVKSANQAKVALITSLEDIFVAVAILTISVGLVLPGMIAHSVVGVTEAAQRLATGTLADFSRAMKAGSKVPRRLASRRKRRLGNRRDVHGRHSVASSRRAQLKSAAAPRDRASPEDAEWRPMCFRSRWS